MKWIAQEKATRGLLDQADHTPDQNIAACGMRSGHDNHQARRGDTSG